MNKDLKEKLIRKRLEHVYCRLAPSPIHGVGIFAIKKIPSGTNPFKNSYMAQDAIVVKKNSISNPEIVKMLNDFHPSEDAIISSWPNQLIWSNYINYSDNPNIELMTDGEWKVLRDIQVGEEILEDPKRLFNENGTNKIFRVTNIQYPIIKFES